MQEQYVRKECMAIAGQMILITTGDVTTRMSASTNHGSISVAAAARVTTAHPSATPGETKVVTGLDDLQRACDAVVRHAMTLYRLCRRPGGSAIDIVCVGASRSGGGAGAASAAEEAAYCVCAAVMALEPQLWASLVRRAQLLRPRKPSLLFVAPVAVPPIVVREVERFFWRSRHLMSTTAAPTVVTSGTSTAVAPRTSAASSPSARGEVGAVVPTASASSSATATATVGLRARQAEAVAACFFFKTMSAAERLRRSDVFEVHVWPPEASHAVGMSGKANTTLTTAAAASAVTAVGAPSVEENTDVVVSSPIKPAGAASRAQAWTAGLRRRERRSEHLVMTHGAAAPATLLGDTGHPLHTRPTQSATSLLPSFSSSASMLFTDGLDDWGGWQAGGSTRTNLLPPSSTRRSGGVDGAKYVAGVGGWPNGSSSRSRDSSPGDGDTSAGKLQGRYPAAGEGGCPRDQQAADTTAVLTRLYALALSTEEPAADALLNAEAAMQQQQQVSGGSDQHGFGGAVVSAKGSHAPFLAAASPVMLTSDSGLSLVALGASVLHACEAQHWGRLQSLVRYPLLFRAIPAPAEVSVTVTRADGDEALKVEAMARMSGALGMTYTIPATILSPTSAAPPGSTAGSCDATSPSSASLFAYMSSLYGAAGSIFSPARLRTSSPPLLLPPPPSLVTDTFLWTRLLICSAWLLVYADGLVGHDDQVASLEQAQPVTDGRGHNGGVWPRVRPTPAVRAIVAYCVAVVREARAMSAGVAATARSGHGSLRSAVCCPVCDDLVKEQRPVLWWSTLRDDRAFLRARVRAVLVNNATDSDEADIAAALADHLAGEGRGRRYATPLLSGSEGTPCRIAALQQRWGAYIMRGDTSATASCAAATAATRRGAEGASVSADSVDADADLRKGGAAAADVRDPAGNDVEEEVAEAAETLWRALTQRVAAATDLCVFLSAHPTEFATSNSLAAASAKVGRPKHPRAEDDEDAASQVIHRHRWQEMHRHRQHAVGSDDSDDGRMAEEGAVVSSRHHPRRRLSGVQHGNPSPHSPGSDDGEWGDGCRSRAKNTSRASAALQGSRHAVEEAEEWSRLLSRCGWVNAAPPSGSTSSSIYAEWASSLFLPSATPTPQQAATLRRRLSRYNLTDVVRKLVLGRGGGWLRYARLLFGDDVCTDYPASPLSCPPPVVHVGAASPNDLRAPPTIPPPAPSSNLRPRAPSLSLLEEAESGADGEFVPHAHASPCAKRILSPVRRVIDAGPTTPHCSSGLMPPSPLPCDATATNEDADVGRTITAERWPTTPIGKEKLPSIPLLVSPLVRRHKMAAAAADSPPPPSLAGTAAHETSAVLHCAPDGGASSAQRSDASSSASVSVPLEQLRSQQAALYALLRFRPRLPPLREEDAVLECASCFSLFHQECIAPVQLSFMGQAFLCHTCRLRWARAYAAAGCGLLHQVPERRHDARMAGGGCAPDQH
ncbi:hypothetical_protein (plasmid) [Leishmania braziliensis MHOM/BR/75/M2904]|nr:hypothetical_protein [Leishmania braziliensis MHOM/BR/75/M2904]